jgi:hypothetical protein
MYVVSILWKRCEKWRRRKWRGISGVYIDGHGICSAIIVILGLSCAETAGEGGEGEGEVEINSLC